MAKEIKPLVKKIFSLDKYKAENKLDDGVAEKPMNWIPLSTAFQRETGLTGIPKGYVTIFRGHSNTGKSTAMIEGMVAAQKEGNLPILIDTENSFSWEHARDIGFEFEEVYDDVVNEETGEIEHKVVNYKGFFIYINNDHLINNFGKKIDKNIDEATVEDVAEFIHKCLDDQVRGDLPYELTFFWDSIGTLNCRKGVESKTGNNQWIAGALEVAFRSIINAKIPGSRKEGKPYTNSFVVINKIWIDNMGMGIMRNKGGNAFGYATRLQILMGSTLAASTKKLVAKANGKEYAYGTQTKIKVEKNHITSTTYSGELVSTAHGFILPSEIERYKKENKDFLLSKLGGSGEITYSEVEVTDNEDSTFE